jgi:hypothetical protein
MPHPEDEFHPPTSDDSYWEAAAERGHMPADHTTWRANPATRWLEQLLEAA